METISVIIPVYNVSKYLRQCIESVLAQTYRKLEIILVDDGSTDGSSGICDKYALSDKRIRVIHKETNEGLVRARKTGVCEATADLIGFVDGDDWIEPDMYEALYEMIDTHGVDIAVCSRYNESEDQTDEVRQGIAAGIYNRDEIINKIFPHMIVGEGFFEWGLSPTVWDKLYKKEYLIPAQMAVEDILMMGEDAALIYPMMAAIDSVAISHRSLYHYRQSSFSMVRTSSNADGKAERQRFIRLYHSVNDKLLANKGIFDFSEQWLKYVLFLMLPRADALHEDIEALDYLFPFTDVKKGERVIVYCAGLYGMRLYNFLKKTNFCQCVAIADRNAGFYRKQGFDVIFPDEIDAYEYDAVVVASSYEKVRNTIVSDLKNRLHTNRIFGIDYETVSRLDTRKAFGLD